MATAASMYRPNFLKTASGVNAPSGVAPLGLPAYNTGNLAIMDQQNIGRLLSGDFDPYEYNMASAENALGTGSGGFAANSRLKLLDSEKLRRQQIGNQMLDPYLTRQHQASLQTQSEAARMREIAEEGRLAMERLQLSESGEGERLSARLKAELEQQILAGNQAMDRLRLSESGATERTRIGIGGNLASEVLRSELSRPPTPGGVNPKYAGKMFRYTTDSFGNYNGGEMPPKDYWMSPSSGGLAGSSIVKNILRQYGGRLRF